MSFVSAGRAARHLIAAALALGCAPARAEGRDFCPDRPGLNAPPCIIDTGRVAVEVSVVDWTRDRQGGARADTVLVGDTLVRAGLTDTVEALFGWTAYGHVRVRQGAAVTKESGVGDVSLGLKANLRNPDGSGASVAVQAYATLPTGGRAIGAGTWSAGVLLPVSFDLGRGLSFVATPELDAAANQSGSGRHLAWGSAAGLELDLSDDVTLAGEVQIIRDRDPGGRTTQALSEASLAWQPGPDTQLDIGVVAGLNRDSPDVEVIAGIARRF
jgi:hypothetical protein